MLNYLYLSAVYVIAESVICATWVVTFFGIL